MADTLQPDPAAVRGLRAGGSSPEPEPNPLESLLRPQRDPQAMTFVEHLGELRERIVRGMLALIIGSTIGWLFHEQIYDWFRMPLCEALGNTGCTVHSREMLEAFIVYIKTAILTGVFATSPYWMYEVWAFIAPGLYPSERKYTIFFGMFGGLLFIGGALFGFFVVFPNAYEFFASFNPELVEYRLSMNKYMKLTMTLTLSSGIIFLTPIAILFLCMLGVVTPQGLAKNRVYAIVVIFIIAAFITPTTDPMTLLLLGIPIVFLFELGLILARIHQRIRVANATREAQAAGG